MPPAPRSWIAIAIVLRTATDLAADSLAIRAGRLIDGQGGAPVSSVVILVEEERITAVEPEVSIPADARVIDLSTATVLPGLIDCHSCN